MTDLVQTWQLHHMKGKFRTPPKSLRSILWKPLIPVCKFSWQVCNSGAPATRMSQQHPQSYVSSMVDKQTDTHVVKDPNLTKHFGDKYRGYFMLIKWWMVQACKNNVSQMKTDTNWNKFEYWPFSHWGTCWNSLKDTWIPRVPLRPPGSPAAEYVEFQYQCSTS